MQDIEENGVCVPIKSKKIYTYDRTRTKVCCFCQLSIRYDCLARHQKSKKCYSIRELLKNQLEQIENGVKIVIPEDGYIQDRKNKKDPNKNKNKKTRKKRIIEP